MVSSGWICEDPAEMSLGEASPAASRSEAASVFSVCATGIPRRACIRHTVARQTRALSLLVSYPCPHAYARSAVSKSVSGTAGIRLRKVRKIK
jgi:hypothetical protein